MTMINKIISSFTENADFGKLIGVSKNSNIHVYKKDGIVPVLTSVKDGKVIKKIKKAEYLECYKNAKLIRKVKNTEDVFESSSYSSGAYDYDAKLVYLKNGNYIKFSNVVIEDYNGEKCWISLSKKSGTLVVSTSRFFRFPARTNLEAGYTYEVDYPSFKPLKKDWCTDFKPLGINFSLAEQDEIYSLAQKMRKMLIDPHERRILNRFISQD